MKIICVEQLTGKHGLGANIVYHELLAAAYPEADVSVFNHKKEWNDFSYDPHLQDLADKLDKLEASDIVVFLGFAWHSRALHGNSMIRNKMLNSKALLIGVFQESYIAKRVSSGLLREMSDASTRSFQLIDIAVLNHYRDFKALTLKRPKGRNKELSLIYLPFLNPFPTIEQEALNENRKIDQAVFVGRAEAYSKADPYYLRGIVLNEFSGIDKCNLVVPANNHHIPALEYRAILEKHSFAFVAPSIDSSLTVRPVEACSAGCIPILPTPRHEPEQMLFRDQFNCFYYDPLLPLRPQLEIILSYPAHLISQVSNESRKTANSLLPNSKVAGLFRSATSESQMLPKGALHRSIAPVTDSFACNNTHNTFRLIAIDLVFFQFSNTGIARVWDQILTELSTDPIAQDIVLLVRKDSRHLPESIGKYKTLEIPHFDYAAHERDALLMDWACEHTGACVFVSTYMTYSSSFFNISLIHDCIPERVSKRVLWEDMWQAKRLTIENSDALITISEHSQEEIASFYPSVRDKPLFLAPNNIRDVFKSSNNGEISFNQRMAATPFCLLVGERHGYLGYKNGSLAIKSLQDYNDRRATSISLKVTGGWKSDISSLGKHDIEPELYLASEKVKIERVNLTDDELLTAYRECICLLYLSEDEGFGLPIYECIAAGGYAVVLDRRYLQGFNHPRLIKIQSPDPAEISRGIEIAINSARAISDTPVASSELSQFKIAKPDYFNRSSEQSQIISEIIQLCQTYAVEVPELGILSPSLFSNTGQDTKALAGRFLSSHPYNLNSLPQKQIEEYEYEIAFLTSTYNSDSYISQLLDNLDAIARQSESMAASIKVQSVIIDSASPGQELRIIRERMADLAVPFVYYRTPYRESLYMAWNRAALASKAKYLTNANTDDRHSPYFAYIMTTVLDAYPNSMLAYPDQLIVEQQNTLYLESKTLRRWAWPKYSYAQLLTGNHVGSTPVWRSDLTWQVGLFWAKFRCAADWEYWLRIATQRGELILVNLPISSYLFNPVGIEHGDPRTSLKECQEIQHKYQTFGEYQISSDDHERQSSEVHLRRLDDMQYSGVVATKIALIVVPSIEYQYLLDIISLGPFGQDFMPALLPIRGTPSVLPSLLCLRRPQDIASICDIEGLDVYIHVDAGICVEPIERRKGENIDALAFAHRLASNSRLEALSGTFNVIRDVSRDQLSG